MKWLYICLFIIIGLASFSFLIINIENPSKKIHKESIKVESNDVNFNTFTSAVCENVGEVVHCRDEVFVNCSGKISKASDFVECNGTKINVPKATGAAVFEKEWKDPRG